MPPEQGRNGPSARQVREFIGRERGIRTLEGLLTLTPLAGVRLRPLGHLSAAAQSYASGSGGAKKDGVAGVLAPPDGANPPGVRFSEPVQLGWGSVFSRLMR